MTALVLAQSGVPVRIIDKEPTYRPGSRGFGIQVSISDSKKQDEAMNPESNLLEEYRKILVDVEIGDKHVLKKRVQKLQN